MQNIQQGLDQSQMNQEPCQSLDDYLAGLLSAEEHEAFVQHMTCCSICQKHETQTYTIEETIRYQNASLVMRPRWQEQMELTLRGTVHGKEQVGTPLVATRKSHRDWRPTAAIAASILAASILWLFFSIGPADKDPLAANITDLSQTPIREFNPDPTPAIHLTSVHASQGFLSARVESDEQDIEFYIVLPQSTTSENSN